MSDIDQEAHGGVGHDSRGALTRYVQSIPTDPRGRSLWVFGVVVYLFGIALTALTVGYAATLVLDPVQTVTTSVFGYHTFPQSHLYVNIFLGLGLALYYLDYAHSVWTADGDDDEAAEVASDGRTVTKPDRLRWTWERVIDPSLAIVLAIAALVAMVYVHMNFERLFEDAQILGYTPMDHLFGAILIFLAIDATRRAFGWVIAAVALLSVVYAHALVGPNLPGVFRHTGMSTTTIFEDGAIAITGVYDSTLMGIGSTWVAIFIMFAGIAKAFGLMDFVLDVGRELGSSLRTGVVQVAVISSMVMGSITGSAAANTATTGSFTIPMIKDQGVRDDFAASIEAVASAGGQMLPPVMGVAAFLMADLTGVSYVFIIQAGFIPAMLFYLSVFVAVHFTILKFGWTSTDLTPFDRRVLLGGLHFAIPLGVLLITLIYLQYTPLTAGMYTIFTIVGVMFLRNVVIDVFDSVEWMQSLSEWMQPLMDRASRAVRAPIDKASSKTGAFIAFVAAIPGLIVALVAAIPGLIVALASAIGSALRRLLRAISDLGTVKRILGTAKRITREIGKTVLRTMKQTMDGFYRGGVEMAPLVGVLAAMGLIVELLEGTGLTSRVATLIIGLGGIERVEGTELIHQIANTILLLGGALLIVLLLAMIASILFGLGMPTPAAYILVVVLVAPGVIEMGVPEITTHMFVFYFAMLSAITPPVAISVAIGSRIAGASFMQSCVQALRLGAPGFVIPFAFVTNNSLIYWSQETAIAFPVVLAGTVGLIVATVGYDGSRDLSYPVRALYVVLAFGAMFGSIVHVGVQLLAAAFIVTALAHARFVVGHDVEAEPTSTTTD